jgi:dihydrofolate synthase/folylpolyglutamate synthase
VNFTEARAYLSAALRFGIRMDLSRMSRLTALLHHPEQRLRCIHVAGTNGKGSVSAYCAAILAAAGYRVGLFTSPYLVRITERIRVIDGPAGLACLDQDEAVGEIAADDFARIMSRLRDLVAQMLQEGDEHPTEFELLTAMGFVWFAEQRCNVVVLETGLGGRLDSTNVIEDPLSCIITALGYDHMDRLGSTLALIAAEKAGIIKPGRPVYLYDPHDLDLPPGDADTATAVIRARCQALAAPLSLVRQTQINNRTYDWSGQSFHDSISGLDLQTRLLGVIQPMNATLAVRACQDLPGVTPSAIQAGIAAARWPARLELLRRDPPILVDGAHNAQCCQALAASLNRLLPDQPVIFLAGVMADKDYLNMLHVMLLGVSYHPVAFICVTPNNPRALPAEELAEAVRPIWRQLPRTSFSDYNNEDAVYCAASPEAAAVLAHNLSDAQKIALCAFGSLYLVGEIRQFLQDREV